MSVSFRGIENHGQEISQPYRDHAANERKDGVCTRVEPFAVTRQVERLQAERGERGVTATDANHEKGACAWRNQPASVRPGERGEQADEERAGNVDEERAPG